MKYLFKYLLTFLISLALLGCESNSSTSKNDSDENNDSNSSKTTNETRIVSLNGTITEVLCELGLEEKIVATDITSNYPEKMVSLPKVGHNRNVSSEGILSQSPTHVLALKEAFNEGVMDQINAADVYTKAYPFNYSVNGMTQLVTTLSNQFKMEYNVDSLREIVATQINSVHPFIEKPTVLFIYARGVGTLNVAGKGTKIQEMIKLAGAQNADLDFENFKPLTAESLIKANPDVILLFDSGYESLEAGKQLLDIPGIAETNAGQNKAFITMDGAFLSSFSPRMGLAVQELNTKIHQIINPVE